MAKDQQNAVPFLDLSRGVRRRQHSLLAACDKVLAAGNFVLGAEGDAFEKEFASTLGFNHAIGCNSGTDAITLGLLAGGVGPGDEVVTVPNTAFPTIAAIVRAGATPRFCDVSDDCLLMDPAALESAIGPRTKAVVPVHLYGNPAPMGPICAIADRLGLWIVEDCAQAHGATIAGRPVGSWSHCGAFSFYPTKNLGALGDGGAVVTADAAVAEVLRRLRHYGQAAGYLHPKVGMNSRLDELQAALLRVKLAELPEVNCRRRTILERYRTELAATIRFVAADTFGSGVAHLAVVRHPDRDTLRRRLADRGIGTLIHYPVCGHLQPGLNRLGYRRGDFPIAERACAEVLSLPCYNELTDDEQEQVIAAVKLSSVAPEAAA